MRRLSFLLLLCALPAFAQVYTVQDEATPLTRRQKLIFTGSAVACVDSATSAATTCTVTVGSGVNTPELIYKTSAGQIIQNVTVTVVDFGTLVVDTDSVVTTGGSWKATLPPGSYSVEATVSIGIPSGATFDVFLDLNVNGTLVARGPRAPGTVPVAAGGTVGVSIATTIRLTTTSDVSLSVYQNSGGARFLETGSGETNRVSIRRVR